MRYSFELDGEKVYDFKHMYNDLCEMLYDINDAEDNGVCERNVGDALATALDEVANLF